MAGYTVSSADGRGRCLRATASFEPGAHIAVFRDPLLAIPSSPVLGTQCSYCLRADRPIRLCTGCRALSYCSVDCQRAAWKPASAGGAGHKKECPVLKLALARSGGQPLPTPTRALLTVMLGGKASEDRVKKLVGNVDGFKKNPKAWEDIRLQAYAALAYSKVAGPEKTELYADVMCKILTNTFNAYDPDMGDSSVFLEPTLAMANHSCVPNAVVQIEGREAVLIAERPITAGDEIFISYIDPASCLLRRREDLRQYHFTCTCTRCTEDIDQYTVCMKYPCLDTNAFSLASVSAMKSPTIDPVMQRALKSIQAPIQAQYSSLGFPTVGMTKEQLKREFALVKPLIQAGMWAAAPIPWFLNDCLGYWCYPSEEHSQDPMAALAVTCLSAARVAPISHPLPWSTYRLKSSLVVANMIPKTLGDEQTFATQLDDICAHVKLDESLKHTIQGANALAMFFMILSMIQSYKDQSHAANTVIASAQEMIAPIRATTEFGPSDPITKAKAWEQSTERDISWFKSWKTSVVDIVEALAELGARLVVQEFDEYIG
ncbi:hypothetical protein BROUX41_005635 [Berkeleyomyces rouxiae]|uniref:uncharacterized protein n=1 Tax=Berkeleyomyces rouxiae TaxID=2035830 RepID=UPI003B7606D5